MKLTCLVALAAVTSATAGGSLTVSHPASGDPPSSIFSAGYIKSKMEKVTDWQLSNPKHKATDWTNGAFYAGVFAAYETTKSPRILDSLIAMGERNRWLPGQRFDHADDIAISQTYIDLYRIRKDRKMIQATIDTVLKIRQVLGPEIRKRGITWWWCDALFMAPPTLVKLGKTLNDPSYYTQSDTLFRQTYNLLYNKEERLYARDASYLINEKGEGKREANGQKIFWSRGNGWVMGGLVRLLKELPKNHPQRNFYLTQFKDMSERLLELQQPDGLWRASLLDPESFPGGEGSGSGFDCYAMAWGINQGILPKSKFLPAVKKAWEGLNKLVAEDGKVGWVQPIGADPRRNFSADSWEVYGAGAYLLAGSEVVKLKQ
ncbi:glycoside hydrolase family 88/105 protein [Siphonobacter aquaeclarae]|uniref:Rhamnogalacturonyl hydrolase YesR n=1 Tax=Siphonobacter aquaeclarae TaxID=563176 RepID=A0A1G9R3Q7_9BACT|nr:glycoside hydrolase family 88 protein [Siphonobacter aquaeclarae]SDM17936.1 Rhamnogalacturonyl hydrolase YesR [Siphonobacter aquaeclarae]